MPLERVVTIGVYGFTEHSFFNALLGANIDLFCDLRARRGLRGSEYAFANSQRLQARLGELEIAYQHFPELAPTPEIRSLQHRADARTGSAKRTRPELDESFVADYGQLLDASDAAAALVEIGRRATTPVLFCVERAPEACHRSLAAERLAKDRLPVQHLLP